MKLLAIFCVLFVAVKAEDFCYNDVVSACAARPGVNNELLSCNAQFSGFKTVLTDLQAYVNSEISFSYDYLLMATHFGNYQKNRVGFEKVFKSLSDTAWENAIDLIKYITKRGGSVDFNNRRGVKTGSKAELGELGSLAKALDNEKHMAEEVHKIHGEVTRRRPDLHDPEVGSYLEEKFMHKQAKCIRELSGYTNDLKGLLQDTKDSSLALYLFDEYLQKS